MPDGTRSVTDPRIPAVAEVMARYRTPLFDWAGASEENRRRRVEMQIDNAAEFVAALDAARTVPITVHNPERDRMIEGLMAALPFIDGRLCMLRTGGRYVDCSCYTKDGEPRACPEYPEPADARALANFIRCVLKIDAKADARV